MCAFNAALLAGLLCSAQAVAEARSRAARGASSSPRSHGLFSPSEAAESEDEANGLQLLQVRGKLRVAAPVCGILWFYHIPKTGGTSVQAWLRRLQAEGALQDMISLNAPKEDDDPIDFVAFHEEKIRPLLRNMTGKLVAVHHHHRGPGLYRMDSYFANMKLNLILQGCSLTRLTFLREPVSQFTSAVNYYLQLYEHLLQNTSARDDYFRAQLGRVRRDNAEVRYILNNYNDEVDDAGSRFPMPLGSSHEDALKAAEAILDDFEVVGLMEDLAKNLGEVAEKLKLPDVEVTHENKQVASDRKYDDQPLPDDVEALIKERTKFDSELYTRYGGNVF